MFYTGTLPLKPQNVITQEQMEVDEAHQTSTASDGMTVTFLSVKILIVVLFDSSITPSIENNVNIILLGLKSDAICWVKNTIYSHFV